MLRRSSEGGLGTSDGLATQNFDHVSTSLGYNSTTPAGAGLNHSSAVSVTGAMTGPGSTSGRRAHSSMSGRYARSWHPSPFASDDEAASSDEPQFYKEEKKNRIKMEIARRRQQIEENACLHDELTRLAKLRETAELSDRLNVNAYGTSPMSPAMAAAAAAAASGVPVSTGATGTSVLKSVDEILRSNGASLHVPSTSMVNDHHYSNQLGSTGIGTSSLTGTVNNVYGTGYGLTGNDHRVMDFSPINSDMIDHRSHFRSSSADPTLSYGVSGLGNSYAAMTGSTLGGTLGGTLGSTYGGLTTATAGGITADPYGGGKYSKYGTMAGSSSLYRKY